MNLNDLNRFANVTEHISPRRYAAEQIAAAVRAFRMTRPLGGTISLEPWGHGKRYVVLGMYPRTLDLFVAINRPDQIEIRASDGTHVTVRGASAAIQYLYARWVGGNDWQAQQVLDGEAWSLPDDILARIQDELPDGVTLPDGMWPLNDVET